MIDWEPNGSSRRANHKGAEPMENCQPQNIPKQGDKPAHQNHDMGLPDKWHSNIWPTHEGTAAQTSTPTGNIHVQTDKDNDEPGMER